MGPSIPAVMAESPQSSWFNVRRAVLGGFTDSLLCFSSLSGWASDVMN